jgi:hypothetical protein
MNSRRSEIAWECLFRKASGKLKIYTFGFAKLGKRGGGTIAWGITHRKEQVRPVDAVTIPVPACDDRAGQ